VVGAGSGVEGGLVGVSGVTHTGDKLKDGNGAQS
jgi:hypothetical protein